MSVLRVLFVCIGNSCRSQMAEGFAKCYGQDVVAAQSAGLAPASIVVPETHMAMNEKNISLEGHFPKSFDIFNPQQFDLLVNMSGHRLPKGLVTKSEDWLVRDPIGLGAEEFRQVRDEIERRVMRLILNQRAVQKSAAAR